MKTLFAAATGSTLGYVVHQRMQGAEVATGRGDQELLVAAPLANVVVAALVGLLARSYVGALLVGFALSAISGTKLDRLVAQKCREMSGRDEFTYPEAA